MVRIGRLGTVWTFLAVLLMATLVASCSSAGDVPTPSVDIGAPTEEDGAPIGEADVTLPQEGGDDGGSDEERLIIRTKILRLEVEKTADAMDQIRELSRTHSGTISHVEVATDSEEWLYREGAALRGWVTVRVPTDNYEDFIAAVAQLGAVTFQAEATSDVTQEHVDMSARLENLRAQEVRLREFFDAAKDVDDMLAIEKELGRVRGEIESLDAQVTYLERQAAMATVTVELTERRAVVRPDGESWGFVDAVTAGIRGAAQLVAGLLTFVIASAPLWIAGIVLFIVIRSVLRRRRARAGRADPASPATPTETPSTPEE